MPIDPIWRSVFSMAEVVSAVGEVERLIDQRKIRHDVADDGVLEHRPVLPRRIVRMAAPNRAVRAGLSATSTGPRQPSIEPDAHRAALAARQSARACARRQLRRRCRHEAAAIRTARRNARRRARPRRLPSRAYLRTPSSSYGSHGRSTRRSKACPLARPARPMSPSRAASSGVDDAGADKAVAHAGVLVEDTAQHGGLARDPRAQRHERRDADRARDRRLDSAGDDEVDQIALPERRLRARAARAP